MSKLFYTLIFLLGIISLQAQNTEFTLITGSPNYKEAPKEYQIWRLNLLGDDAPQQNEPEDRIYLLMPENPQATDRVATLSGEGERRANENQKVQTFIAEPLILNDRVLSSGKILTESEIKAIHEAKKKKVEAYNAAQNAPDQIPNN